MATSLRRSKTMPADGQTAKFLYTIIKQLDLKSIDWNLVASQLEISNGHAARMRYSRFKQHMEGVPTNPRNPRPKKAPSKKPAKGGSKAGCGKEAMAQIRPKEEPQDVPFKLSSTPNVKNEPGPESALSLVPPAMSSMAHTTSPMPTTMSTNVQYPFLTVAPADLTLQHPMPTHPSSFHPQPHFYHGQHLWNPVKAEQQDKVCMSDVFVKQEPQGN
ncbi:predicted protein [Paecilomyces variotii No. 5]|uniref:Myb-like DNA-binding domain-containing protein n=1 Tax=Byssochlamys spectabilis (strain No. 5 / NBRC 109023) TaxID=1356009 RepID=V5GAQ7_BYSSN|nr:predicted protein [Paecilomyces variotii No. 5]